MHSSQALAPSQSVATRCLFTPKALPRWYLMLFAASLEEKLHASGVWAVWKACLPEAWCNEACHISPSIDVQKQEPSSPVQRHLVTSLWEFTNICIYICTSTSNIVAPIPSWGCFSLQNSRQACTLSRTQWQDLCQVFQISIPPPPSLALRGYSCWSQISCRCVVRRGERLVVRAEGKQSSWLH